VPHSLESREAALPIIRPVQIEQLHLDQVPPAPSQVDLPTPEQTQAVDQVFAEQRDERQTIVDAINLAAAGMLVHDIVKDTLAEPEEEDEDEDPKLKPKDEV